MSLKLYTSTVPFMLNCFSQRLNGPLGIKKKRRNKYCTPNPLLHPWRWTAQLISRTTEASAEEGNALVRREPGKEEERENVR
ncbi:hypothetical protein CEXT_127941 [Caerostris extrusa]|uniref:Uncharacterized protein n=1 Tax=Caerostris extrusa TaxID=172846 RepID=A0AAV4ST34_CAEEX|nr:hypothetical protein CEXT_127941 [Caerostris extrusa]